MKNLDLYKQQLKQVEALLTKLEAGELHVDELVVLENLTREMYEKSVILKYKAFEGQTNVEVSAEPESVIEPINQVEEEVVAQEVKEEEPVGIDFSIFDTVEEEEVQENQVEEKQTEPDPEPIILHLSEDEEKVEEKTEAPEIVPEPEPIIETPKVQNQEAAFWEKIKVEDNSLSSQFAEAKLDSLVGAFGLNQKLRYINDLFDGSSELFSDAIKLLDTQSNLEAAKSKVGELASEHAWDPEEESVVEFITFVNRRYA